MPLFLEFLSGNASMYSYIILENSNSVEVFPPLQTFIPLISVRIGEFTAILDLFKTLEKMNFGFLITWNLDTYNVLVLQSWGGGGSDMLQA